MLDVATRMLGLLAPLLGLTAQCIGAALGQMRCATGQTADIRVGPAARAFYLICQVVERLVGHTLRFADGVVC